MEPSEIVEIIKQTRFFSSLTEPRLFEVAELMNEISVPRGKVVIEQGDPSDCLYVIAKGRVKIMSRLSDGQHVELVRRGPNSIFGELGVLANQPRSATVETVVKTTLLSLDSEPLFRLLHENPSLVQSSFQIFGSIVNETTRRETERALLNLKARVARRLLELAQDTNEITRQKRITQVELAQMVGATRQRVHLTLHAFEKAGSIRISRSGITILAREELEKVSSMIV